MRTIVKTLSLVSVISSQVSLTLFKVTDIGGDETNTTDNVTAIEGDDVTFRCDISTGPGQQIVWRKGYEVLSAGPSLLKPDTRYSVTGSRVGRVNSGSKLSIQRVGKEDAGEFVCQVQSDGGLLESKHVLAIQVPPRISPVPPSGSITARQGDSVSLRCNASGVPTPKIAWHKSVGTAPGGHVSCGGTCYTIPHVDLATSGDYICSAVNGVGHPQHATITLHVLYPPEVSCQADQVQGGGGSPVTLGCFVHGEPSPTVNWFRDGHMLESDGRRFRMEWNLDKRMHSLSISRSADEDFGNYSCVASNLMGTSRCFMELNGRPFNLSFHPNINEKVRSHNYYQVRWTTTSHYKVDRFTLLYRKISSIGGGPMRGEGNYNWTTVKIPGPVHHETVLETSWILSNLSATASYECIIQAHNQHGWSSPSPIYVFQTGDELEKGVSSHHNWDKSLLVSAGVRSAVEDNVRVVINCILLTMLRNFVAT